MASPIIPPGTIPPGLSPNEIIAWTGAQVKPPDHVYAPPEPPVDPPPAPPPAETGLLNMAMNDSTDTTVALENASADASTGSVLQIDSEYMTVTDASDLSNLKVTRAACGSPIAAHDVGASVGIWSAIS